MKISEKTIWISKLRNYIEDKCRIPRYIRCHIKNPQFGLDIVIPINPNDFWVSIKYKVFKFYNNDKFAIYKLQEEEVEA